MKTRIVHILFAAFLALLPISLVLAVNINAPTSFSIDSIEAYHHVVEQNDQLYLIKYSIVYGAIPAVNAQDAWDFSLVSSSNVTVGTSHPYAYHNSGYGLGLVTLYFPAASAPTWQDSATVNMTGDAAYTWIPSTPSTNSTTFTKWSTSTSLSDTSTELTVRILYLANVLSSNWTDNLTQVDSTGATTLTAHGEDYFTNTFPNLRNVCPALFSSTSNNPIPQIRTQNLTAANVEDNRLVGTPLDTTNIANFLGVSRMWANGIVWTVTWLALTGLVVWKMQATRVALFVFGFAEIGGAFTGFMGLLTGALVGLLGALSLVWAFMWRQSP